MTNEEAIKYLKQLYPNGGCCWLDEQRMEAISIAVNAIEEQERSLSCDAKIVMDYSNPMDIVNRRLIVKPTDLDDVLIKIPITENETEVKLTLIKKEKMIQKTVNQSIENFTDKQLKGKPFTHGDIMHPETSELSESTKQHPASHWNKSLLPQTLWEMMYARYFGRPIILNDPQTSKNQKA